MAPGVAKTFVKQIIKALDYQYDNLNLDIIKAELKDYLKANRLILNDNGLEFTRKLIKEKLNRNLEGNEIERVIQRAVKYTEEETYQAMEALIHNLNSMHSRAGQKQLVHCGPVLWETLGAAV